ncbi:MAG: hypothetical protein GTO02_04455, partial [Candidatus Dadabacteria bacterium]|nr:hypothetical protein [Candidatus Dadabacteria bacterium]NIQ13672.1 hypothetical protein [Candidatus Dadabacteria bacterium]
LSIFTRKIEIKDGLNVKSLYNRPDEDFSEVNDFLEFVKIIKRMEVEHQTNDILFGTPIDKDSMTNDRLLQLMKRAKENRLNLVYDEKSNQYKLI